MLGTVVTARAPPVNAATEPLTPNAVSTAPGPVNMPTWNSDGAPELPDTTTLPESANGAAGGAGVGTTATPVAPSLLPERTVPAEPNWGSSEPAPAAVAAAAVPGWLATIPLTTVVDSSNPVTMAAQRRAGAPIRTRSQRAPPSQPGHAHRSLSARPWSSLVSVISPCSTGTPGTLALCLLR